MRIGISSYAYTWSIGISGFNYQPVINAAALIHKASELNLPLLQIADNIPLHTFSDEHLLSLKELAAGLHVELEIGAKGLSEPRLNKYLNIAEFFNSKILRFVVDDRSEGYEPSLKNITDLIRNVIPELKQRGIRLAIENHDRFRANEFVWLMEQVADEQVGICLDCANSIGAGESIFETVDLLAPHAINLHLKDIQISRKRHMMGFDIDGVPFGQGIVPLEKIISLMPDSCETANLELWMPPSKTWPETFKKEDQWVKESLHYLKSLVIQNGQ